MMISPPVEMPAAVAEPAFKMTAELVALVVETVLASVRLPVESTLIVPVPAFTTPLIATLLLLLTVKPLAVIAFSDSAAVLVKLTAPESVALNEPTALYALFSVVPPVADVANNPAVAILPPALSLIALFVPVAVRLTLPAPTAPMREIFPAAVRLTTPVAPMLPTVRPPVAWVISILAKLLPNTPVVWT